MCDHVAGNTGIGFILRIYVFLRTAIGHRLVGQVAAGTCQVYVFDRLGPLRLVASRYRRPAAGADCRRLGQLRVEMVGKAAAGVEQCRCMAANTGRIGQPIDFSGRRDGLDGRFFAAHHIDQRVLGAKRKRRYARRQRLIAAMAINTGKWRFVARLRQVIMGRRQVGYRLGRVIERNIGPVIICRFRDGVTARADPF